MKNALQRMRGAYPKNAYFFILASFVNSTGSAFMWPLTTIYVHQILHRSYADAGFVLLIQSLAGVIGQIVGGALYYKLGAKKLIIGSLLLTGFAQLSLMWGTKWAAYMALMAVTGFLMSVTMPVINAFVGFQWPNERSRLFNVIYVSNNVGMAIGTTLGGLLATVSFQLTFFINGLSTLAFAVFFLIFLRNFEATRVPAEEANQQLQMGSTSYGAMLLNYRMYLFLALGSMITWFSTSEYTAGIAPYLTDQGRSPAAYSFLWTVNGIVILAGQPVIAFLSRTIARTLSARLVTSAVCYMFGFGYIFLFHHYYSQLIVGMVLTTFGEMLIAPTTPALITETTGQGAPFYLSVVGSFGSVGRLLGPYAFGHLYDHWGVQPGGVVSTCAMAVAVILFLLHIVVNRRHHLTRSPKNTQNYDLSSRVP